MADFTRAIDYDPTLHVCFIHRAMLLRLCDPLSALTDVGCFLQLQHKASTPEELGLAFYLRGIIRFRLGTEPSNAIAGPAPFSYNSDCDELVL